MRIMARQTSRRMSRRGGILPRKAVPASSAHGGGPYEAGPSRCGTSGLTFCPTYACQYDDIGNRLSSLDLGTNRTYTANALNQYTNIVECAGGFLPQFDDDGNQTLIKTATGVWQVSYNGENRPVLWECGSTNITMKFDRMGRRVEYVETVSGETNTHHRFVYDGYVCIQRLNAASNNAIDLVFGWDPSEPIATRPLVLQKYGQYNLFYTHDGNKNVSELVFFQQANGIAAHYEYAPFGSVTVTSRSTPVTAHDFREYNPYRFSSEYKESTVDLIYYNYRHYTTVYGRWCSRDVLDEEGGRNLFGFVNNTPLDKYDLHGKFFWPFVIFASVEIISHYVCDAYAGKDILPSDADAYKHCLVSCKYASCMSSVNDIIGGALLTLLGGVVHELISDNNTLDSALDDIKSNIRGIQAFLKGGDCEEECKCEKNHWNR